MMILAKIKRSFFWLFYNIVARNLPRSYIVYSFGARKIRAFVCKQLFAKCGKNVNIDSKVIFYRMAHTKIGDNSGIGYRSYVGAVEIGNNVMIGPELMVFSGNKEYNKADVLMIIQTTMRSTDEINPIIIEDDVWIGARVIILPGRRIGRGSVVGAGAVITRDVEPFSIVGGNPARVIGRRK